MSSAPLESSSNGNGNTRLGADGQTYPIGFLRLSFNQATGNAVGGILIADNTGIPLEFMVTTAVRPTPAQRLLYGKRLKSYIAITLCGAQLISNVQTKPRVVFVEDEMLLDLCKATQIPVLLIRKAEQVGNVSGRPIIVPPKQHPRYADVVDLTSLDSDMVDAFDRIEACRELLAQRSDDYKI